MAAQLSLLPEQVPELKNPMPVMRLESATLAPEKAIQGFLKAIAPQTEFKTMGNTGLLAGHDGERLVSFMNTASGESRVFPVMEGLRVVFTRNTLFQQHSVVQSAFTRDIRPALKAVTRMGWIDWAINRERTSDSPV